MRKKQSIGFDTMAIHGVEEEKHPDFALNAPIFMSSTFQFNSLEEAEEVFSFARDQYVYTRGNNPTLRLLEKRLALLEGGVGTVVFSTGMGAISSVLLSLLKPGDEVLAHRTVYGCSYDFLTKFLPQYKVGCRFANLAGEVGRTLDEKVKVIYLRPGQPQPGDYRSAQDQPIGTPSGIKLVVDNTFATPYFQNPLKLGSCGSAQRYQIPVRTRMLGSCHRFGPGIFASPKIRISKQIRRCAQSLQCLVNFARTKDTGITDAAAPGQCP